MTCICDWLRDVGKSSFFFSINNSIGKVISHGNILHYISVIEIKKQKTNKLAYIEYIGKKKTRKIKPKIDTGVACVYGSIRQKCEKRAQMAASTCGKCIAWSTLTFPPTQWSISFFFSLSHSLSLPASLLTLPLITLSLPNHMRLISFQVPACVS